MEVSFNLLGNTSITYNNRKNSVKNNFINQPLNSVQSSSLDILGKNTCFNINFQARTYCHNIKTVTEKSYQQFIKQICNSTESQEFKNFIDMSKNSGIAFQSFIVWLYNKHSELLKEWTLSINDLEVLRAQLTVNSQDDDNNKMLKLFNANAKAYFIDYICQYKNSQIKDTLATYDVYEREQKEDFSFVEILNDINPYNISTKINIIDKVRRKPYFLDDEDNRLYFKNALADISLLYTFDEVLKDFEEENGNKAVNSLKNGCKGGQKNLDNIQENEKKVVSKSSKTFADVGGQDKAIKQLKKSIIFPIKYPEFYTNFKNEKGVILYGPPGTGKSLIANALANEAGCYYKSINATEMESKYVGKTEAQWRKLFKDLEKNQPAILFIDEADALCKGRGGVDQFGDKELNQFLQLVSDIKLKNLNIYIILATNNLKAFDPAVRRSGRFGTEIEMLPPKTLEDVKKIFNIHTKNLKLKDEVTQNIDKICEDLLAKNVTGADIEFIINIAQEEAFERLNLFDKMDNNTITTSDISGFQISLNDITNALNKFNKNNCKRTGFNI